MQRLRSILGLPGYLLNYRRLNSLTWLVENRLAACPYPRSEAALQALAGSGITLLINLHEQPHDPALLARHRLIEIHLPVPDFTAPAPAQLEAGVAAIEGTLAAGQAVAVHCGAGLGRTGALLACYLVATGLGPEEAITRVRAAGPCSVETAAQEAAVVEYWRRIANA
jgi:atypical dual specificity phosphatase